MIERYGGTVEKFIGDAVMAVWGTPVAQEDDAERAVRAALDLVGAVPELAESLDARAGVLTGEAAARPRAVGQGMVAGDLVNTASRIQTVAAPGTVLVGERTRRASEAAIAYDDAGSHEVKGKTDPVQLYRALRVIAARGGALRSGGLEPPFVGRDARAAPGQEALPRVRRGQDGASRFRRRSRGQRQIPTRVGVLQVHRRAGGRRLVAPGTLPSVRRRRHILGAR